MQISNLIRKSEDLLNNYDNKPRRYFLLYAVGASGECFNPKFFLREALGAEAYGLRVSRIR